MDQEPEFNWDFSKAEEILLSQENFDSLVEMLNEPPEFNEKMRRVLETKPPWEISKEVLNRLDRIESLCNESEKLIQEVDEFLNKN